jgi:chain length determinant protein EpsF
MADILIKNVDVRPSRDSSVVDIRFTASDPEFAALVANAWAKAYQKTSLYLKVDPAKQTAIWFDEQLKALRDNLERAQANLVAYQQKMGIVATDDRIDVENAKLGELTAQLVNAQSAHSDALSRLRLLKEFLAKGSNPESLPDVLGNGLIQNLKSQLAQSEARFEQISSQLGRNHPEVQRLQADIAMQRERLRQEINVVAVSIDNAATIAEKRERELRSKTAEQKSKLLTSNQGRDEMAVLIQEVEAAQRAYEAASQRFTQTTLESQANQTNIAVLNDAIAPLYPAFPKIWLNVIVGVVSGLILGVLAAVLFEFVDRRIRCEEDVELLPGAVMLGSLDETGAKLFGVGSWIERMRIRKPFRPAVS